MSAGVDPKAGSIHVPREGRYADLLRALGRFLDEQQAREAEIIEEATFMAVSWRIGGSTAEKRSYNELGLKQLQEKARNLRGGVEGASKGELSDLLRTLGQELDSMTFDLAGIREDDERFTVTGSIAGRYQSLSFPKTDLRELSSVRRASHRSSSEAKRPGWQFWRR